MEEGKRALFCLWLLLCRVVRFGHGADSVAQGLRGWHAEEDTRTKWKDCGSLTKCRSLR